MNCPEIDDSIKKQLLEEYDVWEEQFDRSGHLVGRKLKISNLGELIYGGLDLNFLTIIDNEEIYRYNGGYYELDGEQIIKKLVEDFLEEETKEHYKNEAIGYVRDKNYKKREIFDSNVHLLNLKNGVYNLKTGKFSEHDPKYYFLNEIPIAYKPKAKIKRIKEFFKQIVKKEDIPLLQEIFGYCFYRSYPIQKAIMFLGDGANGKSTTLSLLIAMLGKKNVSAISLQDLVESRFSCSNLYGKLANIYPDITDKALYQTGKFKMVTGGDMLTADRKFKESFNFVNYAKLIYSANTLPEAKDDTDAFFRRWVFVNFPCVFEGKNCDKRILSKLTTEDEMSGLLNFSLQGLKRLLKNGEFTNRKTTNLMRETYQRLSSPIASFMMDCIEIQPENYILKDDLYSAFIQYCTKNNLPVVAKNVFSMRLHEHVKVNEYRPTISGKRAQAWLGIGFTDVSSMSELSGLSSSLASKNELKYDIKIRKHPDIVDDFDNQDLEGFRTIKKRHVIWSKNILMNHRGMPRAVFEKEFYSEFGTAFKADEIDRVYKITKKNIESNKGKNDE